jgi:hypothetical protein
MITPRFTRFTMKKSTLKLAIRRETLRALAQLDLVRVAGGNPNVQQVGTGGPETGCPYVRLDTEGPATGCPFQGA